MSSIETVISHALISLVLEDTFDSSSVDNSRTFVGMGLFSPQQSHLHGFPHAQVIHHAPYLFNATQ
ncbi:MAG: hypothetical protein VX034_09175, partial [Planctomycetota bacterium]|nr:hypothetical protein [Planctomycetota bacterium]